MKNLILLVAIVTASLTTLNAQPNRQLDNGQTQNKDNSKSRIDYLTIVLDLTSEQASKMEQIQSNHGTKIRAIKEQYKPIMEKMRAEMKELHTLHEGDEAAFKEKAKAVKEKYKKDLEPMKESMKAEKENLNNQMLEILNPTQTEKFNKLKALKEKNKSQYHKGEHDKGNHPNQKPQLERRQLDKE